jgi:hypothetical protein
VTNTGSEFVNLARARRWVGKQYWLAGALALAGSSAWAQGIYTCVDAKGRKLTSDRPIIECLDREQRVMNRDGSTRTVLPPSLTADERAELEVRERRKNQERAAQQDAVRRDRLLLMRYPTEAEHRKARDLALDDVRASVRNSERRIAELTAERKPLQDELEFYKGKTLPPKLKQSLEFVDVAIDAHKTLIQNQQAEMQRITQNFDQELERLKKLWAGAPAGSMPDNRQDALAPPASRTP